MLSDIKSHWYQLNVSESDVAVTLTVLMDVPILIICSTLIKLYSTINFNFVFICLRHSY